MKKLDARKLTGEELLAKRKEIVRLHKIGTPVMKIVEISGLSWPAVNVAIKLSKEGGEQSLEPNQRGRKQGTGRILSEEQECVIRNILYRKRPWQVGLRSLGSQKYLRMWSRDVVRDLINQKCGMILSTRCVGMYLKRWGFPLMKKNQRPINRCATEVRSWLQDNYKHLKQRSEDENVSLYWVSRKIVDVVKEDRPKLRARISMISAIDIQGKEHWVIVRKNFTEEEQIKFLITLSSHANRHCIVIRSDLGQYEKINSRIEQRKQRQKIEVFPPPKLDFFYNMEEQMW